MDHSEDAFTPDQLEANAEYKAYALLVQATSFTRCLQQQQLAISQQVVDPAGRLITLFGRAIYNKRTWNHFLRTQETEIVPLSLTEQTETIAEAYCAWLVKQTRCRLLSTPEQLAWLKRVVRLAVVWHIMEHKAQMARLGIGSPFADPVMRACMLLYEHRRACLADCARLIHRIVKEEGLREDLLRQLAGVMLDMRAAFPSGVFLEDGENGGAA